MADWDWLKIAVESAITLATGGAGMLWGTWKAGRDSGKREAEIEKETNKKLESLRLEMRSAVAISTTENEQFIKSVADSFHSLRQKINDVEKDGLTRYLSKEDFKDFRDEYRENQKRVDDKLDALLRLRPAHESR